MERKQSLEEEFANSISHGFGILFSIIAISLLVTLSVLNGNTMDVVSCSIFGASILLLYTFSTLYHATPEPKIKAWLRTFDHIGIYLLIAGTYTPFLMMAVKGTIGWIFFGIVWSLAVFGIVFKIFFIHRFKRASLILYLGMGWMGVLLIKPMLENLSTYALTLVAAGGISYTLGTIFYTRPQMRFAHTIWHLFVLLGTILHFMAIMDMIVAQ